MIAWLSAAQRTRVLLTTALAAAGLFALSGCDETYPAGLRYESRTDPLVLALFKNYVPRRFDPPGHLGYAITEVRSLDDTEDMKSVLDPNNLTAGQRHAIDQALAELFGTPHQPTVGGVDADVKSALQVNDDQLARGADLYRLHCLHCHGLTGNGRGPTAPWVNPHPRDYRSGIFKFSSSSQPDKARKPRREDLLRTLRQGIEGTSMPSFGLQPEADLNAMVSYVTHLSLRGQVEFNLIQESLNKEGGEALEESAVGERAKEWVGALAGQWRQAESMLITPPTQPPQDLVPADQREKALSESIIRGYLLFQKSGEVAGSEGKVAMGCMGCHLDYGRQNNYLNDSWGTIVRAKDLTNTDYRGGRRPIDLYWRIHSGINGANMPASSSSPARDIWDVVNFLQILPYPGMRGHYGIDLDQQRVLKGGRGGTGPRVAP